MNRIAKNSKGFVFIISILTIVFVMGMTAAFFYRGTAEKRFVDIEKYTMQAAFLSEFEANHGLAELRKRIWKNLSIALRNSNNFARISSVLQECKNNNEPLSLLTEAGFTVAGGQATLSVEPSNLPVDLPMDIGGTYSSDIIITASAKSRNPTFKDPTIDDSTTIGAYVFYYDYVIEGRGSTDAVDPAIQKITYLMGNFSVSVTLDNFAKYQLFTNKQIIRGADESEDKSRYVWFGSNTNFHGPIHTNCESNSKFSFVYNPRFNEEVTQNDQEARYYNDGAPVFIDDDYNEDIDVPLFACWFERGVSKDDYKMNKAFADDVDFKKQALGTMSNPGPSGVYVSNDGVAVTGGIFIKGEVSSFTLVSAASGPVYTIDQGGKTYTITVNYGADTTTVETKTKVLSYYKGDTIYPHAINYEEKPKVALTKDDAFNLYKLAKGIVVDERLPPRPPPDEEPPPPPDDETTVNTYNGIPKGKDGEGIIIYCTDKIDKLGGTYNKDTNPSNIVQRDTKMTIVSEKDIVISNNIFYEGREPGSSTIPGNSVLGLISLGKNVMISTNAPEDIEIDAIVAAPKGVFAVDDYKTIASKGTAILYGGIITDYYGPFGTTDGNGTGYAIKFDYDSRVSDGNIPPYFPLNALNEKKFALFESGLSDRPLWSNKMQ